MVRTQKNENSLMIHPTMRTLPVQIEKSRMPGRRWPFCFRYVDRDTCATYPSAASTGGVPIKMTARQHWIAAKPIDPDNTRWSLAAKTSAAVQKPAVRDRRVVLMKNEPVQVDRTMLVYRGLEDGTVRVDVYLLDLDREHGYPNRFPRSMAGDDISPGNIVYRVVSAHRKAVTLHRSE